ncbi:MAG: hypothetical protein PHW14_06630, partial [Candidatus Omnitrophica bacterium]|nr:hypothetical protein [Candidatus Omnitrophota bacterium]
NAEVGDRMYCPGCDVELTVVKLKPPKFKAVEEFEDDDDEESVHEVEEDDDWQDDDDLKEDEY